MLHLGQKNSYLRDNDSEYKKAKETKKGVIKIMLLFRNYKNCYLSNKNHIKITFRSKQMQKYGTNAFKVCESEMLSKYK